jgi:cytochrome c peroxidase
MERGESACGRANRVDAGRIAARCVGVGVPAAVAITLLAGYATSSRTLVAALPAVPTPAQNPITPEKAVLGKILFWDEQVSTSNVVACASCHAPRTGGSDPRAALRHPGADNTLLTPDDAFGSPGVIRSDANNQYLRDAVFGLGQQATNRYAQPMINAAYSTDLFWDGRARTEFRDPVTGAVVIASGAGLESQALGPIVSSVEMAHAGLDWPAISSKLARVMPLDLATNHPSDVAAALATSPTYPELFEAAFGDPAITPTRIAFALATYQRTLISDQTPFDRFRAGIPNAMTPQQVQGFNAFLNSNCAVCHSVQTDQFTDHTFRNIGLRPPAEDLGRQLVTGNAADRGRFKVPSLRNVGLRQRFMHNGQFTTLAQVVAFYARAPGAPVQFTDNRDPIMPQVGVPPQVAPALTDFLQNALTDARVANETFPFDRPTLHAERPADRVSVLAGAGRAGSGGFVPQVITLSPPMLGLADFRIGLDRANSVAAATLIVSTAPPVNGRIAPDVILAQTTTQGIGPGGGFATATIALAPGSVSPLPRTLLAPGTVLFAQWLVADPAAAEGVAFSPVARIPLFCGSSGCPTVCIGDFDADGGITGNDIAAFFAAFEQGQPDADTDADGGITGADIDAFFRAFETGC